MENQPFPAMFNHRSAWLSGDAPDKSGVPTAAGEMCRERDHEDCSPLGADTGEAQQ